MRLLDLNPCWMGAGGEGVYNADGTKAEPREGVGIIMDCPCGNHDESHQLYVPFANPLDGKGPFDTRGWQREGETFETLTLRPSILRVRAGGGCECGWHGFITNGEIQTV